MGSRFLAVVAVLMLTGCAQATPFPITPIPSRTPTAEPGAAPAETATPPPLRYGLLPNAAAHAPLERLEATGAQVDILTDTADVAMYDVLVGYGLYEGWAEAPVLTRVSLVLHTTRPPLDVPEIAAAVRRAAQPNTVITALNIPGTLALTDGNAADARQQLANAGYPDGITLYGEVAAAPGADLLLSEFAGANIIIQPASVAAPHVQLITWHDETTRTQLTAEHGEENIIDLYTLPISYQTARDVTFTDDGWVLP